MRRKQQGETTLETSGEDVKLHSKRVEKISRLREQRWEAADSRPMPSMHMHTSAVNQAPEAVLHSGEVYRQGNERKRNELRIGGNLQSYWTTTTLCETYSRIGLLQRHVKLTVVLDYLSPLGEGWVRAEEAKFNYESRAKGSVGLQASQTYSPQVSTHLPHSFRV